MDNLLTVSQYAAAAGISRQAAYRRIADGKLTEYIKTIDGRTMIDGSVLAATEAPARKETAPKQAPANTLTIDFLKSQIAAKDKQIESMQRTIDALTDALKAAQALHAADKKLLSPAPAETESMPSSEADGRTQGESKQSFWARLFG